jgi:hypothetical protein
MLAWLPLQLFPTGKPLVTITEAEVVVAMTGAESLLCQCPFEKYVEVVARQPKALAIPKTAMSAVALIRRMKVLFIGLSFQGLMWNIGEDSPPPSGNLSRITSQTSARPAPVGAHGE